MGEPKHLLRHRETGETLLSYQMSRWVEAPFRERFVVHREVEPSGVENSEGWVHLFDPPEFAGQGPLVGILAALRACGSSKLAILAVDYPELPELLLLGLAEGEAEWTTVTDSQGQPQWLCSVLSCRVLSKLEDALQAGVRSVHRFARSLELELRQRPSSNAPSAFQNLNLPEDLPESRFESARC